MVITWTVRSTLQRLTEQGVTPSYGAVLSLRPFNITFVTEKEIASVFVNSVLKQGCFFEPLMTQAKRDNDDVQDSITEFFMYDCECPKSSNVCYNWNCVAFKCKVCKKASPMPLTWWNSDLKTRVHQFKTTEKPCQKVNKDGTITKTITKDRESWAYTDFWRDIQQIVVP